MTTRVEMALSRGAGGRPHPLSSLELCQGGALLTLIDELCHCFLPHPTPSSVEVGRSGVCLAPGLGEHERPAGGVIVLPLPAYFALTCWPPRAGVCLSSSLPYLVLSHRWGAWSLKPGPASQGRVFATWNTCAWCWSRWRGCSSSTCSCRPRGPWG